LVAAALARATIPPSGHRMTGVASRPVFEERQRTPEPTARQDPSRRAQEPPAALLRLQRGAGNKAVSDMLRAGRPPGQPTLQRYFFARGKKQRIDAPAYIINYLLTNRAQLGIRMSPEDLATSFWNVARDQETPTRFSDWLRGVAPAKKADDVLRDAWAATEDTTAPRRKRKREPGVATSDKRRRIKPAGEMDEDLPPVLGDLRAQVHSHLTGNEPEPELESDPEDYEMNPKYEFGAGPDRADPGIVGGDDKLRILVITWNLEKSGAAKREIKLQALREIVDAYHPAIMVMQEVTDAGILFDGAFTGGMNPVPYSLGLNLMNLVHQAEQIQVEVPEEGGMETDENEIPHYPLGNEYGMAEGPTYRSGTYQENYPLLYERAQVDGTPKAHFVRGGKSGYRLDPVAEGQESKFGTTPTPAASRSCGRSRWSPRASACAPRCR
jgi:hypothetical protein